MGRVTIERFGSFWRKRGNVVLKIEYLEPSALKPYENNARAHKDADVSAIVKSIQEFGFNDPIGIWGGDNLIVEGHGRLQAAIRIGMDKVPCIRLDELTDEQRRAYALAHNKTAELSKWDFEILDSELKKISAIDMASFGFDIKEDAEVEEDDFVPREIKNPKSKLGDIYQLGDHRLMCGDSTDLASVEKLISGEQMDLVVTDPPYNVGLGGDRGHAIRPSEAKQLRRRTDGLVIANDWWENQEDFIAFLEKAFKCMMSALKPGGAFYIWFAATQTMNFYEATRRAGMEIRQELVWSKTAFTLGRQDYQWKHEPCLYGWKEGAGHYFITDRTKTTVWEESDDFSKMKKEELVALLQTIYETIPTSVIKESKPWRSVLHPTMKPVALLADHIKNSSKRDEKVLDLFGGSGSTMIACEQLGRKCYMMELDPQYVDTIIERWEQLTGEKAQLVEEEGNV